jgi:hypothetical protein
LPAAEGLEHGEEEVHRADWAEAWLHAKAEAWEVRDLLGVRGFHARQRVERRHDVLDPSSEHAAHVFRGLDKAPARSASGNWRVLWTRPRCSKGRSWRESVAGVVGRSLVPLERLPAQD